MPEDDLSLLNNSILEEIPRNIIQLAEKRLQSRKNKEWDEADRLRSKVSELGYQIEDNNDGYSVSKLWDIYIKCGIYLKDFHFYGY